MPAPAHLRLTWSGVFGSLAAPAEEWSFGLSANPGDYLTTTDEIAKTARETLAGFLVTAFNDLTPRLGAHVRLTRVRVSEVAANGKTRRATSGEYRHSDQGANVVGLAAPRYPFQIAQVVTCRSLVPGPTGRGRFFLPGPTSGINADTGLIGDDERDLDQAAAANFLGEVTTALGAVADCYPVVASGGSVTKGLSPALHRIDSLDVGRTLDTMRSRRSHLTEDRQVPSVIFAS